MIDVGTYEENLKLLEKFKPTLLQRIVIWLLNPTGRIKDNGLEEAYQDALYESNMSENNMLTAYYAKKELDRRKRRQKKFIEKLEKK